MAPQLARAVGEYGVTVYSSGGFDSVTLKYEAAVRIAARDVPTVVIHVGDLDRSGLALVQAAAEDVDAFAIDLERRRTSSSSARRAHRRAGRAARPADRAAEEDRQALRVDRRRPLDVRAEAAWVEAHGTVQAEALPPDVLAAEVRQAVEAELDMDAFAEAGETEAANREAIEGILRQLRGDEPEEDE